jgi:transcriptional regulator with XRE-family HTH domain
MTQLEKIRKAKGFLQEDVAKASGVNTSITDVGPKLTVANDSKTENKIINLRKSLNTLANDEGEEISQFFQANLDAGIIDEDMLHIFDDYSNGEENAMGKDTSDEGEQPSDKGDEPLPQFYQAMIDAGVITADDLREWNSFLEGEKGEDDTRGTEGDDGEIENLVNAQTLEKDAEAATEAEDKLMKIIALLGEKEQKKVKTYLTKHQTDKEFLLGLLGKHQKLLFSETSDKSSKNGVRLTYYVISDTNERPTRISATLKPLFFKLQVLENGSDVIGKLDEYNKKLKKAEDAVRKEILGIKDEDEEDDKYKSEITIDDYDDYLAEVKKRRRSRVC